MKEPGAGELSRRVVIRRREDFPDESSGGIGSAFPERLGTWAKIEAVGSVVYSAGVQADSIVTHRVTIRYRHGITDAHEIVEQHDGLETVYRVRRSSPLNGRRNFTVLEVEELWTSDPR